MSDTEMTPAVETPEALRARLLEAALPHVPFDGWSEATFRAAMRDAGLDAAQAALAAPRGALDLAVAFHRRGDEEMRAAIAAADLSHLRFSERIAWAVRRRIEVVAAHREAVRRGAALFALPIHAAEGAALMWGTADAIWTALGDTSDDFNWYSKRATLSAVLSATVLYWLGDQSEGYAATWAFLDRRIADVMKVEQVKARLRETPLGRAFAAGPGRLLGAIKAPRREAREAMPGRLTRR